MPGARKNTAYANGEIDPYVIAYREREHKRRYGDRAVMRSWDSLSDKLRSRWRSQYLEHCRTTGRDPNAGHVEGYSDESLVERAVRNARNERVKGPRWSAISRAFGLGSTYSAQLCRRFKLDPDEVI